MMNRAQGPFEVKLKPQPATEGVGDPCICLMSIDKQFQGDLDAVSKGEMLAVRTAIDGSAGYVAMERVTGTIQGRQGSFALQHFGVMTRGTPELKVTVVADSGTGELVGIAGTMKINIDGGKHSYDFEYTLADQN
jgi:hypothetical protein